MRKKSNLCKKILTIIIYYLYFISVIIVMYKRGFAVISFLFVIWALLVALGLLESLVSRKKRMFFNQIDRMQVEEFYDEVIRKIIVKAGYIEKNRSIKKGVLILKVEYYKNNSFCIVCFVKKDYVYDTDFIDLPIEENSYILLCLNSYYRGSKYNVYIDRKDIWKYYGTVAMNKD